jgi:hypothetical protein
LIKRRDMLSEVLEIGHARISSTKFIVNGDIRFAARKPTVGRSRKNDLRREIVIWIDWSLHNERFSRSA